MDTSDEWILQRTGIRQRHWVDATTSTSTSDLALEASNKALESAKTKKSEIDMIILATLQSRPRVSGNGLFSPGQAGYARGRRLWISGNSARGSSTGCRLPISSSRRDAAKKVLLVGAEVHSKGLDKTTRGREVSVLFGDGAGAVVIGEAGVGQSRILSTHLHADGNYAKELWVKAAWNGPCG